jgi:hypothetical protein
MKRRLAKTAMADGLAEGLDSIDRMTTRMVRMLDELLDVAWLEMR